MGEPKVLVIDRSKWRRGNDDGESRLLDMNGQMCCLGFDALACGLTSDQILGTCGPVELDLPNAPDGYAATRIVVDEGRIKNSLEVSRAILTNDSPHLTETEREPLIREALIAIGWDDVQFVN